MMMRANVSTVALLAVLTASATVLAKDAVAGAKDTVDTAGCVSPSPGQLVSLGDRGEDSMYIDTAETEAAIGRIRNAGEGRFPDSFAGLGVDPQHGVTTVYRVPDAAFDAYIAEVAGPLCFRIRPARHSAKELKPWRDRIEADLQAWTDQGVPFESLSTDGRGEGIRVGSQDPHATEAAFRAKYGADAPIFFEYQEPAASARRGEAPPEASKSHSYGRSESRLRMGPRTNSV
jgi:hypothetical protein